MEIEKAREIGFCFGVRRAINLLEGAARRHGPVETLGAVVHNQTVIEDLERQGVNVVGSLDEVKGAVVAIPSHGVGPQVLQSIQDRKLQTIDATCPRVRHAQRVAREMSRHGFYVIVFGDANHPEVKGVLSWAGGNGVACVNEEILPNIDKIPQNIGILSQTTQSHENFARFAASIVDHGLHRFKEIRLVNTICHATSKRQVAAIDLAGRHDLIFVVGSHSSSNTRRLLEVCQKTGVETHLVETANKIEPAWLDGKHSIGITAGTSTPDQAIDEVLGKLRSLSNSR